MPNATGSQSDYLLGSSSAEYHRLNRQGRLISKLTQHFLDEIGLAVGMRVLDIGSGVGDVGLLAARIVGDSGRVVCLDSDESALSVAEERAAYERVSNMVFHAYDFHQYPKSVFDAVIGRCVLLHQSNPLATLKTVRRHLRPGGIVAFQEPWFSRAFSSPEAPLFQKMLGWMHQTVQKSGLDADIGIRLPSLYESAGLPRPRLTFEMLVDCAAGFEIYDFCTDTVRSLLPRIVELGISTPDEICVDTLGQRLRDEASELETVIGVMPLVGAWSKSP